MKHELDARGLLCPLPVLKARKRLTKLKTGDLLLVFADDPAAWIDFPSYCQESGNHLQSAKDQEDGSVLYVIKKCVNK